MNLSLCSPAALRNCRRGSTAMSVVLFLVCLTGLMGVGLLVAAGGWLYMESVAAAQVAADEAREAAEKAAAKGQDAAKPQWISLFNGKDLKGWKATEFGGEGDVTVKDGRLILGMGNDMTGVTIDREIPKINYVVELEAMRVDGSDFFCGLTFPVNDKPCSLVVGGWGGGVCGLSSINGFDASENSTTTYQEFDDGKWYKIRCRVTDKWIEAWLGDEQIVNQNLVDRTVGIRPEVELSKPFGIATWRTTGALRNIRIRPLTAAEIKEIAAKPVDE